MAVERIVALHMQMAYYDSLTASHGGTAPGKVMEYLHERAGQANRRSKDAMRNLARIHKLLPHPIKVEVAVRGKVRATVKRAKPRKATKPKAKAGRQAARNRIKSLLAHNPN